MGLKSLGHPLNLGGPWAYSEITRKVKITLNKGIAKGGVKNRNKGGCKRLFAFVHVCSHLRRRVPPCAVKSCAVRPVFAGVVGELRAADPSKVQGPAKQNASPREQSEAPRPRRKPGQEQHPGPENQDSQHMLKQPRGYFSDCLRLLALSPLRFRLCVCRRLSAFVCVCLRLLASAYLGVFQRPLTLILPQKYRDTNGSRIVIQIGGVYTTFCQEEGILLQKYADRNGRCIAILFKSIGVRGRFTTVVVFCHHRSELLCRSIFSMTGSLGPPFVAPPSA